MIGSKIPRYLFLFITLGVAVAAVMLSILYPQYRWLANEITSVSSERHEIFIRESFVSHAEAEMHALADHVAMTVDPASPESVRNYLHRAVREHFSLTGLRFVDNEGNSLQAGNIPDGVPATETAWLVDDFVMSYPVSTGGVGIGLLIGSFQLDQLQEETSTFSAALL